MHIEAKLAELGLMLPEPMKPPPGVAEPPPGSGCAATSPTSPGNRRGIPTVRGVAGS